MIWLCTSSKTAPRFALRQNSFAAREFGISKSTVHKDLTERLPRVNPALYGQVRQLLDINKAERHIRGGLATRRKYRGEAVESK